MSYCLPIGPNNQHIYFQNNIYIQVLPYATLIRNFNRKIYLTRTQNITFLEANFMNVHNLYKSQIPEGHENHPILNEQGGQFLNGMSRYHNILINVMQFQ